MVQPKNDHYGQQAPCECLNAGVRRLLLHGKTVTLCLRCGKERDDGRQPGA